MCLFSFCMASLLWRFFLSWGKHIKNKVILDFSVLPGLVTTIGSQCEWRQSPPCHICDVAPELAVLGDLPRARQARRGPVGLSSGLRWWFTCHASPQGMCSSAVVGTLWSDLHQQMALLALALWKGCLPHVDTGHIQTERELLSGRLQQLYWWFSLLAGLSGTQAYLCRDGALPPATPAVGWGAESPWAAPLQCLCRSGLCFYHFSPLW